jgi:Tfp pilus assembly protein PilF
MLVIGFGTVGPLGLLGMWLARDQWRRHLPLYLYALTGLATALLFFVSAEYRLPVVPVFMIFAAHAAVTLGRSVLPARPRGGAARRRRGKSPRSASPWVHALLLLPPLLVACNVRTPRLAFQSLKRVDYLNYGNLYSMRGDLNRAKAMFEHSLAIDPSYALAYEALAGLYAQAGDNAAALRAAEQARRFRPAGTPGSSAGPSQAFGDSLLDVVRAFEQKRYSEALEGFERLRRRAETGGDSAAVLSLLNNIGLCHYRMRDLKRAEAVFREILARDPRYLRAHTNLARVLASEGRAGEAIAELERARALAPADPHIARDLMRLRGGSLSSD